MKHQLQYEGIDYPKYFYDPSTEELFGHRGKMKMQTSGFGWSILVNGKAKYISAKKLREAYSLTLQNDQDDNAIDFIEDIMSYEEPKKKNLSARDKFLLERGLSTSMIWITDLSTLVKAQELLDQADIELFTSIEERATGMLKDHSLTESSLIEVMVQVASSIVLAKEHASRIKYLEEYNNMDINDVKHTACVYFNEDVNMFLVEEWAKQFRERFYSYLIYVHKGVALRGYTDMRIHLTTIEQIQSAFKLLTNLYGWKEPGIL